MKVRFKITAAFMLLMVTVLAALCIFVYYYSAIQKTRDFERRLQNRAVTVASLLFNLPVNEYGLLSRLDSATSNLLVSENINVFNSRNQRIYRFARNYSDTIEINSSLLTNVRLEGRLNRKIGEKQLSAIYYQQSASPVVIIVSAYDENGRINLEELRKLLLAGFLAGTFLSLFFGWIFSRELLRPVKKITKRVNNITANNIEMRLPVPGINDELSELAVTFNELLSRLQESFDMQGRFISNASHELSTPLTSVSNQIDVALMKTRSQEEYLDVLKSVRDDIAQMSALTQQLLNLARSSRGGALLTEPVRIDEVIMELPALLKKISPDYSVLNYFDELPDDENSCRVIGNYELLLSAFKNIAENGCKYSSDKQVKITLTFSRNKIIIAFSNVHAGLNPAELDLIFQPFQRGSNAGSVKGYGLGLSLTRRIILLHNGEIKAETVNSGNLLISVILPAIS